MQVTNLLNDASPALKLPWPGHWSRTLIYSISWTTPTTPKLGVASISLDYCYRLLCVLMCLIFNVDFYTPPTSNPIHQPYNPSPSTMEKIINEVRFFFIVNFENFLLLI